MKALITGADGFVAQHIRKELELEGYKVISATRTDMNVTDYEQVRSTLHRHKPDYIFHTAAIAFVPSSWQDPELVFKVNTLGSLNLFNAVRSVGIDPTIQICGSSEEYGLVYEEELPITEENQLRPLSPYAVSKIAMDYLAYQYYKSYDMKIIRTRAFNHEGYGRGEEYMPSSFAKQLVEIEKKLRGPIIYHGDLSSIRDITDVRDVARAYRLAVEVCKPGEVYNIGSGSGYSAGEILDRLIELSKQKVEKVQDPKRMRPSDVKVLRCDSTKFRDRTGWEPKYTIDETLSEELRYWREHL